MTITWGLPPERFAPTFNAIHQSIKHEMTNVAHLEDLAAAFATTEQTVKNVVTQLQQAESRVADAWHGAASTALMQHVRNTTTKAADMDVFVGNDPSPSSLLNALARDIRILGGWLDDLATRVTVIIAGHRLLPGYTEQEILTAITPFVRSLDERYPAVHDALSGLANSDWA